MPVYFKQQTTALKIAKALKLPGNLKSFSLHFKAGDIASVEARIQISDENLEEVLSVIEDCGVVAGEDVIFVKPLVTAKECN